MSVPACELRAAPVVGVGGAQLTVCLLQDVSDIIAVYETGYSVSLVALLLSLGILCYFK